MSLLIVQKHTSQHNSSFMCAGVHVPLTGNELALDRCISFTPAVFWCYLSLSLSLCSHRPPRVGAVWPSPPSHGCHGQRLLRRVRRAASAGHRYYVPQLARSPGRGDAASAPAAFLLVVSQVAVCGVHRWRHDVCIWWSIEGSLMFSQRYVWPLCNLEFQAHTFNSHTWIHM